MFDLAAMGLPIDVAKFKDSPEFERLIKSVVQNIKSELNNPDSSIGLALNALFVQLTEKDSIVMNECDFTFMERNTLSPIVGKAYSSLKG